MPDNRDVYSPYKASHHQDRLDLLKQGKQPYPVFIQLIISDLCNENCHFCLIDGTMVATPSGDRVIESIKTGDYVYGLDGLPSQVLNHGSRFVDHVFEIKIGNKTIVASKEHPILTRNGWVDAENIKVGDEIVIREAARQGSSDSSIMSMWMRSESETTSGILESLYYESPTTTGNVGCWEKESIGFNEEKQSDETSRNSGESFSYNQGTTNQSFSRGNGENSRSGTETDAIGCQPNERSSETPSRNGETVISGNIEEREAFQGLGGKEQFDSESRRNRKSLDRKKQSGFQSSKSKESNRNNSEGVLHERKKEAYSGRVWITQNSSLQFKRMGMFGCIQTGPSMLNSERVDPSNTELFVGDTKLERGLVLRQVDSVRRIEGKIKVNNIECDRGHAFEANGVAVHNCAYRMDNYTSNKWFGEEDPVSGVINNNPNRMIPYEKVVEILDDCVAMNTRAVEVTGGGEPTVHPKHREIFEGIIERGLDGALVTNGVLLRSGVAEILSNFKWVRVSIDAAHAKTYSVMREVPEGHFDKVIKHVGEIVTAKQANSQSDLVVGVGFVVTKENYKEIMEATKIASDLGVDNIRFSAMFGTDGLDYFKDIYVECRDTVREAVAKYQRPDFTVFNLFGERIGDLEQKNPDYQLCGFMNLQTYIGGDQNVYRCCNTAYNPQGFIGSLKFQSLKQLWDSKAKQDNFTMFDAKTCSLCMFNAKNKYINYLIENDPAHKNFV